jgi:DNA primase
MMYDLATLKAGITIENVLDHFGIAHRHHRAACPVHGGDNRSAFSFNDDTFYCHTHGCKGDVVTLIMALAGVDFKGALDYLARMKGITAAPHTTRTTEFTRDITDVFARERRTLSPHDFVELVAKTDDLNRLEIAQWEVKDRINKLTAALYRLNQDKKNRKIVLNLYYLQTQKVDDNKLAILDERSAVLNYDIKKIKQEISQLRKLGRR